jgi:hypothetical protein
MENRDRVVRKLWSAEVPCGRRRKKWWKSLFSDYCLEVLLTRLLKIVKVHTSCSHPSKTEKGGAAIFGGDLKMGQHPIGIIQ